LSIGTSGRRNGSKKGTKGENEVSTIARIKQVCDCCGKTWAQLRRDDCVNTIELHHAAAELLKWQGLPESTGKRLREAVQKMEVEK
jgi:hypothetical protein